MESTPAGDSGSLESFTSSSFTVNTFAFVIRAKVNGRKTKVPSFYLDMTELGNYWGCDDGPRR